MLVKEDKPNSCYHFVDLLQNLQNIPAADFVTAIRGTVDQLPCDNAYDLIYNSNSRYKSVNSFREIVQENPSPLMRQKIMSSPIMLLDPIKPIQD